MNEEIPADWVDMEGRQLELGDRVVAAFTLGRSAELRTGRIVGWSQKESKYTSERRRSLQVLWDRSSSDARFEALYPDRDFSRTYGPVASGKPTSIQYEHMKHLVISR